MLGTDRKLLDTFKVCFESFQSCNQSFFQFLIRTGFEKFTSFYILRFNELCNIKTYFTSLFSGGSGAVRAV